MVLQRFVRACVRGGGGFEVRCTLIQVGEGACVGIGYLVNAKRVVDLVQVGPHSNLVRFYEPCV